ncbi:flagellar hook capping FlgD N-terminal domain-containing protein [Timonella senegalensis]|uniref:flagellar hook capping FlgD N-terminal domain-containing protein n=1 Tax=Timonella senegalensis TaxID=1465825 RepID=UPI002FDD0CAF
MSIDPAALGVYTANDATAHAGRAPKNQMDSEMFLNLLVAQLKYQDPTAPMDTSEMMAQTTGLATMEQLTSLSTVVQESFALTMRDTAAALLGRTVTYVNADGQTIAGKVSSVKYEGAVPTVEVNGESIPLDAVASVTDQAPGSDSGMESGGTPDQLPAGGANGADADPAAESLTHI